MTAINFKSEFAQLIAVGGKPHTIRAPRVHPFRLGEKLHLYTGMRTARCRLLGEAVVKGILKLDIDTRTHEIAVRGALVVDGLAAPYPLGRLDSHQTYTLARADGFPHVGAFFDFFSNSPNANAAGNFAGHLIWWADSFKPASL